MSVGTVMRPRSLVRSQLVEMLLVRERVLDGQEAAPRVAEQVEVAAVEAERLADLLHFLDEARHLPQRFLRRLIAVIRPELVVVAVLDALGRQVAVERLEVLVRERRAAVQNEHLDARVVADALGLDAERAFWRLDGNQLDPAGQHIVATRLVEISRGPRVRGRWSVTLRAAASGEQRRKQDC